MNKYQHVCNGSLMDGLDIDLLDWAGIDYTDDEYEKFWEDVNDRKIMDDCDNSEFEVTGEIDEIPGQSDEFFKVYTWNIEALKNEIREKFKEKVDK